jgi:pyruvate formate lyase activating enzyme
LGKGNLGATGHCTHCGTQCPGVFDGPPGDWGQKRVPVNMKRFSAQKKS